MLLCEPLVPATLKFSGLVVDSLRLLRVSVLVCPGRIALEEKEHVKLDGHVKVIDPVKELGADTVIGKVVEVAPTVIVEVGADDETVKTATPVPDKATVCGLPLALSAMDKLPLRAPLATGWNTTLAVQLCPTLSKPFKGGPVQVSVVWKSPLALIFEMERVCVPVLVIVTVCGELTLPTFRFPNDKLVGVTVTCVAEATPVPESAIVCGLPAALSVMLICPAMVPSAVGVKVTGRVQEPPPAAMVPIQLPPPASSKSPVTLVVVVVTVIAEMVRFAVPMLMIEIL